MKKSTFIVFCMIINSSVFACPVCERNKTNILQSLTHGSNPESNWEYVIVVATAISVVLTLYYSVKLFLNQDEQNKDHIKYSILTQQ